MGAGEQRCKMGNQPSFLFQDIRVDTKNENRLYNIHDQVEVSEDGGKTFSTLIPYSGIHPDHHAWWISPERTPTL